MGELDIAHSFRCSSVHACCVDGSLVTLNVFDNFVLMHTASWISRTKIINHSKKIFPITTKEGSGFTYLNYRITQSSSHATIDQTDHMRKITLKYFETAPSTKKSMIFWTDKKV